MSSEFCAISITRCSWNFGRVRIYQRERCVFHRQLHSAAQGRREASNEEGPPSQHDACLAAPSSRVEFQSAPPLLRDAVSQRDSAGQAVNTSHTMIGAKEEQFARLQTLTHVTTSRMEHESAEISSRSEGYLAQRRLFPWASNQEHKRAWNQLLQGKSQLSYDWRVPLKLLKQHSRIEELAPPRNIIRYHTSDRVATGQQEVDATMQGPRTWSTMLFLQYVTALANFQPPRLLISRLLGFKTEDGSPPTTEATALRLLRLFHQADLRQFVTIEACNIAMWFFSRHHKLAYARELLVVMEHLSVKISTPTFDFLLRAAAHQRDLHNYTWLLQKMIARDIRPGAHTWMLLVECLGHPKLKTLVIDEMYQCGMTFTPDMKKHIARATIQSRLSSFLAENERPEDFLQSMRICHGPNWMSTRAGNIILNAVSKRESVDAGLRLIPVMKSHSFVPDQITLNTLVNETLKSERMSAVLQVLEKFEIIWKLHPGQMLHEKIFHLAWKRRYLNVCRVLWISACLQGFVTYELQRDVSYSLRFAASQHHPHNYAPERSTKRPGESSVLFQSYVGKFVLGLNPLQHHSVKPTQQALAANLKTFKKAELRDSLSGLLQQALSLDRDWNIPGRDDLTELIRRPLPVSLKAAQSIDDMHPG